MNKKALLLLQIILLLYVMSQLRFINNKYKVLLLVFLFINSLFILKYGIKYPFVPISVLFIIYFSLVFGGYFVIYKKAAFFNTIKNFPIFYIILTFILFITLCVVNFYVDGFSLNSDRWSAMHVTIESILNGKYPYSQLDHLGQTSSNLPGLFFIGLPFYLMGDISLLQPFVFLILVGFIYFIDVKNHHKLALLFLLLVSPAYLFEVFIKSDLMSNLFLVLLFISVWSSKFKENIFKKTILLAFFCALFSLTRGIVVIPLTVFLFSKFYNLAFKQKLKFIFWLLLFVVLITSIVLFDFPDYETLKEHNPFNHQTAFAPKFLIVTSLVLPFLFSFLVKKTSDVFLYSFYIISTLLIVTFVLNGVAEGFYNNLHGNLFDITYLGMILPFIFFYVSEVFKRQSVSLK